MSRTEPSALDEALSGFKRARLRFFEYRAETGVGQRAGLAVALAALTGLAAQVRIPLPFTPVPITLQTFAVLLSGVVLGARWGGASQGLYAGLGAAGVPWFAGATAGVGRIVGPTGGYIVGFVLAAAAVGYVVDRSARARRPLALVGLLFAANFLVVYGVGLPWLYGWLSFVQGGSPTVVRVFELGLVPFVVGDVVKLLAAAGVGYVVLPNEPVEGAREAATRTDGGR